MAMEGYGLEVGVLGITEHAADPSRNPTVKRPGLPLQREQQYAKFRPELQQLENHPNQIMNGVPNQ
jgi:hypothetical protein